MYIVLKGSGRIKASSLDTMMPDAIEIDAPEGFTLDAQMDYRMENGVLVHDPLPPAPPAPTEGERLAAVEAALLELALGGELYG